VFLQERAQEPWELLKQRFNAARDAHAAAAAAVDAEVVAAEAAAAEKAAAEKAAAEESRPRVQNRTATLAHDDARAPSRRHALMALATALIQSNVQHAPCPLPCAPAAPSRGFQVYSLP
jgi:hypothetical protein